MVRSHLTSLTLSKTDVLIDSMKIALILALSEDNIVKEKGYEEEEIVKEKGY